MTSKARLLLGAAGGVFVALAATQAADARPAARHVRRTEATGPDSTLKDELRALREQVQALQARLDAQGATQQQLQARVESAPARSADSQAQAQARIDDLEARLAESEQAQAVQTAAMNAAKPAATVALPNGRPSFASADGRFTANLHAVAQFDAGKYFQDKAKLPSPPFDQRSRDLNSGTNLRRARLGIEGKLFGDFEYNFLTEFGGSGAEDAAHIHEVWGQYSGWKPWHFRIGYFEPLIGMNANISTSSIPFLERASPAEVSRNVAAGDTRAAFQLWGNDDWQVGLTPGGKTHWLFSVALTGNTGSTLNSTGGFATQPFDEQFAYIGRIGIAPYGDDWTLHLGLHGQHVVQPNDLTGSQANAAPAVALAGRYTATLQDRPELRLDTTRLVSTGALNAEAVNEYGLEAGLQWKSFFAQGEYFHYGVEANAAAASSPRFSGWYVEGTWFPTGESRTYAPANGAFSGVTPKHNFSLADRGWGAFELGARYSDLDLNYNAGARGLATPIGGVRGGEQKIWTASLNWYLNPTLRFTLQGQDVTIERLTGTGLSLGQTYRTLALRSQFAF